VLGLLYHGTNFPFIDHYGKTEECRALKCLPCAFHRAHDKHHLCRAFPEGRTANNNARFTYALPWVFIMTHGNYKPLPCVFLGTHGNTSALTFDRPDRADQLTELMGVNLCRATWKSARQRQQVCRAFLYGARQSYTIVVRFCKAHGNEFLKKMSFRTFFQFLLHKYIILHSIFQLCNHIFLFANLTNFFD
jgi:hypothetical protein